GLAKAALALYHRSIPPHGGITEPLDCLAAKSARIYSTDHARPWLSFGRPRRAAVSAFGFGGANTHVVLEEAPPLSAAPLGADRWPCELFLFGGSDRPALLDRLRHVRSALESGAQLKLRELALSLAQEFEQSRPAASVAVVAGDTGKLLDVLA